MYFLSSHMKTGAKQIKIEIYITTTAEKNNPLQDWEQGPDFLQSYR